MQAHQVKNGIIITFILAFLVMLFFYIAMLISVVWVYYPIKKLDLSIAPANISKEYRQIFFEAEKLDEEQKPAAKLSKESQEYLAKIEKYIADLKNYIAFYKGKSDVSAYEAKLKQAEGQYNSYRIKLGVISEREIQTEKLKEYINSINVYLTKNGSQLSPEDKRKYEKYLEQANAKLRALSSSIPPHKPYQVQIPAIASLLLFISILYGIRAPLLDFRPFDKAEKLHGDARWASEGEIVRANMRDKKGLLLGNTSSGYLINYSFQHVLLFAPTGSGKGVGFVIPNLLFWEESAIVHDIKLENYELTSGYRKNVMGHKVYLWNPASPQGITHCYNPLDFVSREMGQMVDDCQKIANLLMNEENDFWEKEARSLLVGVMLYLCSVKDKKASFGEIVRTLKNDDVIYSMAVILDTKGDEIHPVAHMNLASFVQKPDKERGSVLSTANSGLELWANPLIDTATATSDFDFNFFRKEKTTVYVGLTPDNIERLQPLMQVFYQQAAQIFTKKLPTDEDPYGVLLLIDEFPTLGEMPIFKQGIAYFRGYKVRLFLVIQDTEQLKDIYEEAGMNSFFANATFRVTFASNTIETAKKISEMIGNKTVKQYSRNSPVFLDLNPASRSKNISETQRALLLPQEVIGLPRDEQIVLVEGAPPIKSKKIIYYKDSFFTKRLLPKVDVPKQTPYDPRKLQREKAEEEAKKKQEEEAKKLEQQKMIASKPSEPQKKEEAKPSTNKPQNNSSGSSGSKNVSQPAPKQPEKTTPKPANQSPFDGSENEDDDIFKEAENKKKKASVFDFFPDFKDDDKK
ncbi:MAG: type IV secretory system conjugative DNA transfer family protein [Alphaproteobacteria bacterium]